eukprot:3534129-Pyramimonas_sp.AAC.1
MTRGPPPRSQLLPEVGRAISPTGDRALLAGLRACPQGCRPSSCGLLLGSLEAVGCRCRVRYGD